MVHSAKSGPSSMQELDPCATRADWICRCGRLRRARQRRALGVVGLALADRQDDAFALEAHVGNVETDKLAPTKRAGEADEKKRAIPFANQPRAVNACNSLPKLIRKEGPLARLRRSLLATDAPSTERTTACNVGES